MQIRLSRVAESAASPPTRVAPRRRGGRSIPFTVSSLGTIAAPYRLAAFTHGSCGGNPAGVVFVEDFPDDAIMLDVAAKLGYSETAFVQPCGATYALRYFAPRLEVPFCGHATVAAVAALGERLGAGRFALSTRAGPVQATAKRSDEGLWRGGFDAPAAASEPLPHALERAVLDAFAITDDELDHALGPALVSAGARHVQVGLRRRERLASMDYDSVAFGAFMRDNDIVTINLLWRESATVLHSRNAFASGGVFEDPATGAAAAALGGYLHARGQRGTIAIRQGDDMGQPCRIVVTLAEQVPALHVAGDVRELPAP